MPRWEHTQSSPGARGPWAAETAVAATAQDTHSPNTSPPTHIACLSHVSLPRIPCNTVVYTESGTEGSGRDNEWGGNA